MEQTKYAAYFFRRRWPNGFSCPSCGYGAYYTIATRTLPLYECRLCKHQTTVTAGTVMEKTRTSLAQWAAALELLASTNGVNAKQLACAIGVKHKTAWLMLRKLRLAIGEAEDAVKLQGSVHAGLDILAPRRIFVFLPHRRYRCERVVAVSASVDSSGMPSQLKLRLVDRDSLVPRQKELAPHGRKAIVEAQAHPAASWSWLSCNAMHRSPIRGGLLEARAWMNRLFYGVRTKYLQSYLNEFCYRRNAAARGTASLEEWEKLCFRRAAS